VIDEKTRTAHVRVEFENAQGKLRLNQLVTARYPRLVLESLVSAVTSSPTRCPTLSDA
jgi:hypothetical protein